MSLTVGIPMILKPEDYDGEEKNRLSKGFTVLITGIKSRPHWNGAHGTVLGSYNERTGRWPISIDKFNAKALLKSKCIAQVRLDFEEFKKGQNAITHITAKGVYNIDINRCNFCGKRRDRVGVRLKKCKHCYIYSKVNSYVTRYCGRKCQKNDWHAHKEYCGTLFHQ